MRSALARLAMLLAVIAGAASCGAGRDYTDEEAARARTNLETLQMRDVRVGPGEPAKNGRRLFVQYTGWLYDPKAADKHGKKFDSSREYGEPFSFTLGAGRVIRGWDQGVAGMKVGGTRTLVIPSELAYGARGAGRDIPPNATLVFDVELLAIR